MLLFTLLLGRNISLIFAKLKDENMTKEEILLYHDLLYEYLLGLHEADNNFRFQVRQTNRKLTDRYWFNGDDKMLQTSFWEYRENHLKKQESLTTLSLELEFNYNNKGWTFELFTRSNPKRNEYLKRMAEELGNFSKNIQNNQYVYHTTATKTGFIESLHAFIQHEKPKIDAYLNANPIEDAQISFIDATDFENQIKKINNLRKKYTTNHLSQFYKSHIGNALQSATHMGIDFLYVNNYQGITDLIIEKIPADTRFIFLTGENGTGKTSLLRAIAKGFLGDEEQSKQIDSNTSIYISGTENKTAFFRKVAKGAATDSNTLGYGIARFRTAAEADRGGKAYSLFEDDGVLLSIETVLKDASPERFEQIKNILQKIVPNLYDIQKIFENGFAVIKYQEKSDNGNGFQPVTLKNLAAGFRGLITLVGDMLRRFTPTFDKPTEDIEGVVLIDEFDAHLHPKYQYELPKLLSDAFPKVQFIVSTHSPIPLLGLPADVKSVVLTVYRTTQDGITVERLDDEVLFHHLLPNSLLTSPIFGFPNLFPRNTPPAQIFTEDHWEDIENFNLNEELNSLKSGGFME
jgi:predicted ATPase